MKKTSTNLGRSRLRSFRAAAAIVVAVALLLLPASHVGAQPPGPHAFYGQLHADGSPAPVGTHVVAEVNGEVRGSIVTLAEGKYGSDENGLFGPMIPKLLVQGDIPAGATIEFYANGAKCDQTATFEEWARTELNLTVPGPLPPPDTTAPYTSGWAPARGAIAVPIATNIVVHVRDDGAGVNSSTIVMKVNGAAVSPTITGTPADFAVTYDPPVDFGYLQTVSVTVDAKDRASPANTMTTDSYSFTTQVEPGTDTSPPYTSALNPSRGATGVPVSTNIVVHVRDDGAGVNSSTIVMKVNGAAVSPTITGTPADFAVTYDPPVDFGYLQTVSVTVDAKDLASPANTMTTDSYSFTTQSASSQTPGGGGAGGGAGGGVPVVVPTLGPTVTGTPTTTSPAAFELTGLNIDPTEIEPGEIVVISVRLVNTGGSQGSCSVCLVIDGQEEATVDVADLAAGSNHLVSFTVTKDVPGTYTVEVGDLAGSFTVLAPLLPAAFSISGLTISPAEVIAGETVTISFDVTNTGELGGIYTATLKIDGVAVDAQDVTLAAGETRTVTFTLSRVEPGVYEAQIGDLELGGLSAIFTVVEEAAAVSWSLVGGIIGGLLVIALLLYFLLLRRRPARETSQ